MVWLIELTMLLPMHISTGEGIIRNCANRIRPNRRNENRSKRYWRHCRGQDVKIFYRIDPNKYGRIDGRSSISADAITENQAGNNSIRSTFQLMELYTKMTVTK